MQMAAGYEENMFQDVCVSRKYRHDHDQQSAPLANQTSTSLRIREEFEPTAVPDQELKDLRPMALLEDIGSAIRNRT